jgi:hypothetical protein
MRRLLVALSLVILSLLRCASGDATPDAVDALDVPGEGALPSDGLGDLDAGRDARDADAIAPVAMPVPVCGLASHAWLPFDGMGALVSVEPQPTYSYKKELLKAMAGQFGYADVLDARYDVAMYRVRYVTQDRGVTREATATVGLPVPEAGQAVTVMAALILHGTCGFADPCAPSRGKDGPLAAAVFATQGQIAVAPDYLGMASTGAPSGMPHPYLVGEATAIASWDALRAAERLLPDQAPGVTLDPRVLLFGGSQGGHAALFVDRYAPWYAPEFEVLASAALTAPADLIGETDAAVRTFGPPTEALSAALMALARWYGLDDRIGEVLRDEAPGHYATTLRNVMDATGGECSLDLDDLGAHSLDDVFQPGFVEAVKAGTWAGYEDWRCLLAENSITTTSVPRANDTPTLSVLSGADELEAIPAERAARVTMCEQGYDLTEIECQGASHTQGMAWDVVEIFGWMADRLAGKPLTDACTHPEPTCCAGSPAEVCVP